ncbi:MAG TPA: hypothetical protein VEA41_10710 [Salinarimonas sp.]|jgi:hypothetical protein|nr:hypothetical protein [Salinarimonas sp.]
MKAAPSHDPAAEGPERARRDRRAGRRRRIERELKALHLMDGSLRGREIAWALLAIPGIALLWLVVFLKLHWLSGSLPAAIGVSLALGTAVWWIGRYWFALAGLVVLALCIVAFEDAPDLSSGPDDRRSDRRRKLERAIAKRERLLRELQG